MLDCIGLATADKLKRNAQTGQGRSYFVRYLAQKFLLFLQQGLNAVRHSVEIPREIGQFIFARTYSRNLNGKISIRDFARDGLQGANGRGNMAGEDQAKHSADQSGQEPLKNGPLERSAQYKTIRNENFGNQDVSSVGTFIHGSACPKQADVKSCLPASPRFCENFLGARRHAAAHDVVAVGIKQSRLKERSVFDLLQVFGKRVLSFVS